ncbi:TetR/AcrR family transcriptional regulator, partial [Staphylococcus haemolyticus]
MGIYILLSFVLSNKIQRKDRSKLSVLFSSEQLASSVYMQKRDRRVSKTKKAIYQAFLQVLNDKGYDATTVQDIIDLADVGRSTFY